MIVKNNTVVDLSFNGIPIVASGQVTIDDNSLRRDLSVNNDFITAIENSDVTINDGSSDLAITEALYYVKDKTFPDINLTLCGNTYPYIQVNATSYQIYSQFLFPGTNIFGDPKEILTYYTRSGGLTDNTYMRIYDKTNSNVIAERNLPAFMTWPPSPTSLGTLSNLPANEAILEIQCYKSGTVTFRIRSLSIRWR